MGGGSRPPQDRADRTIDQNRLNDYSLNVPAYVAAARLAVHRSDRNEAGTYIARAMRAPTDLHLRDSVAGGPPPGAARQDVRGHRRAADGSTAPLAEIDEILIHRPALGALAEDVTSGVVEDLLT